MEKCRGHSLHLRVIAPRSLVHVRRPSVMPCGIAEAVLSHTGAETAKGWYKDRFDWPCADIRTTIIVKVHPLVLRYQEAKYC